MRNSVKKLALVSLTMFTLSLTTITAFACGGHSDHSSSYQDRGCTQEACVLSDSCTDANHNGICDNRGTHEGCGYSDADEDGICDHASSHRNSRSGSHHR